QRPMYPKPWPRKLAVQVLAPSPPCHPLLQAPKTMCLRLFSLSSACFSGSPEASFGGRIFMTHPDPCSSHSQDQRPISLVEAGFSKITKRYRNAGDPESDGKKFFSRVRFLPHRSPCSPYDSVMQQSKENPAENAS